MDSVQVLLNRLRRRLGSVANSRFCATLTARCLVAIVFYVKRVCLLPLSPIWGEEEGGWKVKSHSFSYICIH